MILASQSPRRIELLREAGFDIAIQPACIDEAAHEGEAPLDLVARLASTKALTVAASAPEHELIIGADTIVILNQKILGKPQDNAQAHEMLRALSGKTHLVATAVCIAAGGRLAHVLDAFVDVCEVEFWELSDTEIDTYIASGEPMDKAGAYGIQGIGGRKLVKGIHGDFYTVVGLPIARLARVLTRLNSHT
ncbi:Maf family protein [Collinsella sp. AGMB00827]|uniref:dTTP/UTP pyrophosphatase n=1 Tax=Collinsella ureilytica TaxID=2869515 RepID=A0ABS7MIP2_9ACTN|nr:Maf family protein [Collinsella urealyticum]MBY4796960.1 Maf family protein [Collinsella urealyticum]